MSISCTISSSAANIAVVGGLKGRLMVPLAYTAGDKDLRVQLQASSLLSGATASTTARLPTNSSSGRQEGPQKGNQLRISTVLPATKDNGFSSQRTLVATLFIYPDPFSNVTQIVIPCHHLSMGGIYELEVLQDDVEQTDERLKQQLDVR